MNEMEKRRLANVLIRKVAESFTMGDMLKMKREFKRDGVLVSIAGGQKCPQCKAPLEIWKPKICYSCRRNVEHIKTDYCPYCGSFTGGNYIMICKNPKCEYINENW